MKFPEFIKFSDEKEIDVAAFLFEGKIIFVDEPYSGVLIIKSDIEL